MATLTLNDKYLLIKESLLKEKELDPIKIIKNLMYKDFINIHGPEHHFLDGASFLVVLHNNGLNINLEEALDKLKERTIKMPGAMCGFWGICGSVASLGACLSIIDETGPLSNNVSYSKHMDFTSKLINKMSKIGGPHCCKRNAFLALIAGKDYAKENYKINIHIDKFKCDYSPLNNKCLHEKRPFFNKEVVNI